MLEIVTRDIFEDHLRYKYCLRIFHVLPSRSRKHLTVLTCCFWAHPMDNFYFGSLLLLDCLQYWVPHIIHIAQKAKSQRECDMVDLGIAQRTCSSPFLWRLWLLLGFFLLASNWYMIVSFIEMTDLTPKQYSNRINLTYIFPNKHI